MWDKIKAGLGLNKAELAAQANAELLRVEAIATAAQVAREKRIQAKVNRAQAKAEKAEKAEQAEQAKSKEVSLKDIATANGEPWIEILGLEVDETDPGQGAFELDWNDIFVARLVRAGYQGKTDQDIVDNWFKVVCRNVVTETYEQDQADPEKRAASRRRDLGNGRTEVS
jgi:hypothetical protein